MNEQEWYKLEDGRIVRVSKIICTVTTKDDDGNQQYWLMLTDGIELPISIQDFVNLYVWFSNPRDKE